MQNDTPLSPETQNQIDALTHQISLANHLDPEIQKELRTHLEDKLHAYLTGQLPLSEADALLLAKSHFGNPATIKALFQHVHPIPHTLSLARRLAAAAFATILVGTLTSMFHWFWVLHVLVPAATHFPSQQLTAQLFRSPADPSEHFTALFVLGKSIELIFGVGVFSAILHFHRIGSARRKHTWLQQWKPLQIASLIFIILATTMAIQTLVDDLVYTTSMYDWKDRFADDSFRNIGAAFTFVSLAVQPLLWLWWCDRAPRTWRSTAMVAASWVLYSLLMLFSTTFFSFIDAIIQQSYAPSVLSKSTLDILSSCGYQFTHFANFALVCAIIYRLLTLRRPRVVQKRRRLEA